MDVLPKFVRAYNNTIHLTTGMAPSRVTDSEVLAIWKRLEAGDRAFAPRKRRFAWGSTSASVRRKCGLPRLPNRISAPRYFVSRK